MKMCIWFVRKHQINICYFFHVVNFFASIVYIEWVYCVRNSSYRFQLTFLKLCRHFLHGLKICIWFGHKPQINFCHVFHVVN